MENTKLTEKQKEDFLGFCSYTLSLMEAAREVDDDELSYDFKRSVVIPYALKSWFNNKEKEFVADCYSYAKDIDVEELKKNLLKQ